MFILGLLLVIGTGALTVGAVYDGSDPASVEILGKTVHTTVAGVFFAGALTMLAFLLGCYLIYASMGRAKRRRARRKEMAAAHERDVAGLESERTALQEENVKLSERLAGTRSPRTGTDSSPSGTDTGPGGPSAGH
jgi:hypothetical protein